MYWIILLLCFTSFPPQLNRQKFWFIIATDHTIINPIFTLFHLIFMGCRDCDSFGHKNSPQILFSLQWFFYRLFVYFFLHSYLCVLHTSLFSVCSPIAQECSFFSCLFVPVFMKLEVWVCVCVSCTFCEEQKWTKVPACSQHLHRCTVYLQLNLKIDTYSIISCLGEVWEMEREQLKENERGTATDDYEEKREKK